MTKRTPLEAAQELASKMSTWELFAAIFVGKRDKAFTEEGLKKGLEKALGEGAPEERSIYTTLSGMSMFHIINESGDFTYYRVTSDRELVDSCLKQLAERGYDCRSLEKLQPVIDRVWKYIRKTKKVEYVVLA